MSGGIAANNLVARGRFQLGARAVSAAELLAAGGLLTILIGETGAYLVVEAGATIKGITVRNIAGDDLTNSDDDLATALILVASPVAPWGVTLVHESLDVAIPDPTDRLYLPSLSTPGSFANATLGQHASNVIWCPVVGRWRVSWLAA